MAGWMAGWLAGWLASLPFPEQLINQLSTCPCICTPISNQLLSVLPLPIDQNFSIFSK
jgi:hypothetical protein